MSKPGKTVVKLAQPHHPEKGWSDAFLELEPDICDLVRRCDLATHVYFAEQETGISDDGSALKIVLEELSKAAKSLKALYYEVYK
jgi:hypothetical protein